MVVDSNMVYRQFPDLQWLKRQVETNFANRSAWEGRALPTNGWPTVILNVATKNVLRDNIRGPLSIFTNISGESQVAIDGKRVNVKDDLFFVTNHDQHYTLEVGTHATHTLNIHFGEYFTEQVFASLNEHPHLLLEKGEFQKPFDRITFPNKLHFKGEQCKKLMGSIVSAEGNEMLLQEKLYELMVLLLQDEATLKKSIEELPVMKSATREELSRRMLLATDLIYSNLDKHVSLDELAAVSCLSKFHFLRLFKIQFGKTPHQFITEAKTARAKSLLKNSKLDVMAISRALGFKDASSFSRTFFNTVGVYPSAYR
jgi:AraC family transcriptional regulator